MCGIIGVFKPKESSKANTLADFQLSTPLDKTQTSQSENWAALEAYKGLLTLQHRGQDASGILSYDFLRRKFYSEKNTGLVANVFNQENLETLFGNVAIGHTRYATAGTDGINDLQPLVTGLPLGLGMVHNGNIVNYQQLADKIKSEYGHQLLTSNDLEIFLYLFCNKFIKDKFELADINFERISNAILEIMNCVDGGYACLGVIADRGLISFRDPNGIRPLIMGRKKNDLVLGGYEYAFASETLALTFLGHEVVKNVAPGELIYIDNEGVVHSAILKKDLTKTPCMFEWVYFSGAEGALENHSIYSVRLQLGRQLAKKIQTSMDEENWDVDIVVPVPDTSRTASLALSEELKIPYREALIKNRYVHRSFILNSQEKREKAVELKLSPVRSEIEGKNIILVDDSVVRGTTSKKIISLLKKNGVGDVTLAITCPPISYACYYGIDFPTDKELLSRDKTLEQIANWLGAKKVIYLETSDLVTAIGEETLCMACVDNKYPTSIEQASVFAKSRRKNT
jgi:amidophosphoribosyltransferase